MDPLSFVITNDLGIGNQTQHYSRPAITFELSAQAYEDLKLSSSVKFVDGSYAEVINSAQVKLTENFTGRAQLFYDQPSGWTQQYALRYKIAGVTAGLDYSPDAFGAGKRSKVSLYTRQPVSDRFYVWTWQTYQFRHEQDRRVYEGWVSANYKVNPLTELAVQHFESDVFGSNLTLRVIYKLN